MSDFDNVGGERRWTWMYHEVLCAESKRRTRWPMTRTYLYMGKNLPNRITPIAIQADRSPFLGVFLTMEARPGASGQEERLEVEMPPISRCCFVWS